MCIWVHSSVWAKGEMLEERLRAKKQPLGDLSLTLSSWGGGFSPTPPQIQGVAQVPFPNTCTDPWASITARCVPAAGFSQLPHAPFSFLAAASDIPAPRLSLPSPTQLQELLWRVGDGVFLVSSQLGSPGNPGSGKKDLGSFADTSLLCIISQNG